LSVTAKYPFPEFLSGIVPPEIYARWLFVKADAHFRRDRKRGNTAVTRAAYKMAIHKAVVASLGLDDYTGEKLDWSLVCQYDNDKSNANGRQYKASLSLLPTVDHVDDGLGEANFRICGWRTNDAKSDMRYSEFLDLCRRVIEHSDRR
jgi:hypothetical protein